MTLSLVSAKVLGGGGRFSDRRKSGKDHPPYRLPMNAPSGKCIYVPCESENFSWVCKFVVSLQICCESANLLRVCKFVVSLKKIVVRLKKNPEKLLMFFEPFSESEK